MPPLRPWPFSPLLYLPVAWWATTLWKTCGCDCDCIPELVMPKLARLIPVLNVDLAVFSRMSPLWSSPVVALAVS
ncbi:hypothetical protein D3C78_1341480 [compost metagenome]